MKKHTATAGDWAWVKGRGVTDGAIFIVSEVHDDQAGEDFEVVLARVEPPEYNGPNGIIEVGSMLGNANLFMAAKALQQACVNALRDWPVELDDKGLPKLNATDAERIKELREAISLSYGR